MHLLPLLKLARVLLLVALGCVGPGPVGAQPRPDRLVIVSAEVGLFGPPAAPASRFLPAAVLPLKDGQEFGWKISLRTTKKSVRVWEELTLPSEPRTWGDPEPGLKRKTSPDGRTATTEQWLAPVDGIISSRWSVTSGDPRGAWVLKVRVEDQAERVFRLDAR